MTRLFRVFTIKQQGDFLLVDSQVIQIASLTVNGAKKDLANLSVSEQKQLLSDYSKYEMDYFSNDQKIEVINPENQWVSIKSKHWLIWYFRVWNLPIQVEGKTAIQLFASTIIGDKILDLNAPIQQDGNFGKAALIVNQMMESLIIDPKN